MKASVSEKPSLREKPSPRENAIPSEKASPRKLKVRNAALGLAAVALAFYFGFIALLVVRAHH